MTSLLILFGILIGIVLIVLSLFVGISYIYRRKKPLTRAMDEERKRLDAKRGVETPQAAVPKRSEEGSEGNGVLKTLKKHVMGNGQVLFLICVAGVALYYTYNSTDSLAELSKMARARWMFLLAVWGILAAFVAINIPKEWGKTLQSVLALAVFVVLIGYPIGHPVWKWIMAPSGDRCTKAHPCALLRHKDGSSEVVLMPKGHGVEFEPSFWEHPVGELGFKTSFNGGPGRPYLCSYAQAVARTCFMLYDQFWFEPSNKDVSLPGYWFTEWSGK